MLLVYGPRSTSYDFGPSHPLTPRRFGPSIDLLEAVGAKPGLAPEPVSDAELEACHSSDFVRVVREFSADPFGLPNAGISEYGDVPPFAGMHEAGAMVAGGSLRAMEAILRGDVDLAVLDCSFPANKPGPAHLHAGQCGQAARDAGVSQLVLSHFYQIAERYNVREQAGEYFSGKIKMGRDLACFKIG